MAVLLNSTLSAAELQAADAPPLTTENFKSPPASVRPKYRWWVPEAHTDLESLQQDLSDMARAGAGGAELSGFRIPGPGAELHSAERMLADYGWMSPKWLNQVTAELAASNANGVILDQTFTSMGANFVNIPMRGHLNDPDVMQQLVFAHSLLQPGKSYNAALPATAAPSFTTIVCQPAKAGSTTLQVARSAPFGRGDSIVVGTPKLKGSSRETLKLVDVGTAAGPCSSLAAKAEAGSRVLKTWHADSRFKPGDQITIGTGRDAEHANVVATGSPAALLRLRSPASIGSRNLEVLAPNQLSEDGIYTPLAYWGVHELPGRGIQIRVGDQIRLGDQVRTVSSVTGSIPSSGSADGLGNLASRLPMTIVLDAPLSKGAEEGHAVIVLGDGIVIDRPLRHTHGSSSPVMETSRYGSGSGLTVSPALRRNVEAGDIVTASAPLKLLAVVVARCSTDCSTTPSQLDHTSAEDGTQRVRSDGSIEWSAPAGRHPWALIAFYQTADAYFQGLYSPGSPDSDINLLRRASAQRLMSYWDQTLFTAERQALIRKMTEVGTPSLFIDSYEFSVNVKWTDDFLAEYRKRFGHSFTTFLPAIAGANASANQYFQFDFSNGVGQRARNAYRQLYTELHQERFLKPVQKWLEAKGMTLRAQLYNGPLDTNYAASLIGLPDSEGGDIYSFNAIAAGAHMRGSPLVAFECCATFGAEYRSTYGPGGLLSGAYRGLIGGATQVVWHGWSYNGNDVPEQQWPGYHTWASLANADPFGEPNGPRSPHFVDQKSINDALARQQLFLRQGKPRFDVAVYWWNLGSPARYGAMVEPSFHHSAFDPAVQATPKSREGAPVSSALAKAGYTFEFMSPAYLTDASRTVMRDGVLFPEQSAYRALVLSNQQIMPLDVARRIRRLVAEDGLKLLVIGEWPNRIPTPDPTDAEDRALQAEIEQLKALRRKTGSTVVSIEAEAEAPQALRRLGITPAVELRDNEDQPLLSLRRDDGNAQLYYFYNPRSVRATEIVGLTGAGTPYTLDPWTGEVEPVAAWKREGGRVVTQVEIAPGDTAMLIVSPSAVANVMAPREHIVNAEADVRHGEGGRILARGSGGVVRATSSRGQVLEATLARAAAPQRIERWMLDVESWGPGAAVASNYRDTVKTKLEQVTVAAGPDGRLPSWLSFAMLRDVSGIGTYSSTFQFTVRPGTGAVLDLGEATDTVALKINGKIVPVNQMDRRRVDVSDVLLSGENRIDVRVATTLQNAVRIHNSSYRGRPRQEYGLFGPVILAPYSEAPMRRLARE